MLDKTKMRIRVIDLETTGFEPPEHAVCDIGWVDLIEDDFSTALLGRTGYSVQVGGESLVNPCRSIPPETSAVHHIIDEDVLTAPEWTAVAPGILQRDDIIAFAAHSAKFERQWCTDDLTNGKPWICTYKCALRLWPDAPVHSNQGLRYWRKPIGLQRDIASVAHRAYQDAYVTAFHLRDLLELAPIEDLIKWSSEPALQVRCHIGKQRGMLWRHVDYSFLEWVASRDFDEDVLFTVNHEMDRRRAEWEAANAEAQ